MEVIIKGAPSELFVHTVSIIENDDKDMYQFNCIYCGTGIQQYQGQIDKIYPYLEPYDRALTVTKCRKCYMKYTFQSRPGVTSSQTKIILYASPIQRTTFFCYFGRQPLLVYNHSSIVSLRDTKEHILPFALNCVIADCPVEYFFKEVV